VIRALVVCAWYSIFTLIAGLLFIPWTVVRNDITLLYKAAMWGALFGVRLGGVRVQVVGREQLDPRQNYVFMCNHTSNLDPAIVVPLVPRPPRTSVLVKKELFRAPLLGTAMRLGKLVPVDRRNRDAAVESVRAASAVLREGLHMTIFPEGTRSYDGRLLPFKKGPFYLALDAGLPIVPMTIVGTHELWPKGKFAITPGTVMLHFHQPLDPKAFSSREELMEAVRRTIESALPERYRGGTQEHTTQSFS
jgi:1-acyl-sn-glycerol-3-phosphate acyltransferase